VKYFSFKKAVDEKALNQKIYSVFHLMIYLFQKYAYYLDITCGAAFKVSLKSDRTEEFDIVSITWMHNQYHLTKSGLFSLKPYIRIKLGWTPALSLEKPSVILVR
jgi:hypothetical protein